HGAERRTEPGGERHGRRPPAGRRRDAAVGDGLPGAVRGHGPRHRRRTTRPLPARRDRPGRVRHDRCRRKGGSTGAHPEPGGRGEPADRLRQRQRGRRDRRRDQRRRRAPGTEPAVHRLMRGAPFGPASAVAAAALLLAPSTSRSAEGHEIVLSAGTVTRWAYLLGPAVARARPSATARVVTTVAPATPEGESNLVVVMAERRTPYAPSCVRVRLSILPNGST